MEPVEESGILYQLCHFSSKHLKEKWPKWYSRPLSSTKHRLSGRRSPDCRSKRLEEQWHNWYSTALSSIKHRLSGRVNPCVLWAISAAAVCGGVPCGGKHMIIIATQGMEASPYDRMTGGELRERAAQRRPLHPSGISSSRPPSGIASLSSCAPPSGMSSGRPPTGIVGSLERL